MHIHSKNKNSRQRKIIRKTIRRYTVIKVLWKKDWKISTKRIIYNNLNFYIALHVCSPQPPKKRFCNLQDYKWRIFLRVGERLDWDIRQLALQITDIRQWALQILIYFQTLSLICSLYLYVWAVLKWSRLWLIFQRHYFYGQTSEYLIFICF